MYNNKNKICIFANIENRKKKPDIKQLEIIFLFVDKIKFTEIDKINRLRTSDLIKKNEER